MSHPSSPAVPDALPEMLDPLRFPLHGSRLIEASAGTGKTYTIAALYVRLVLGHGEANAYLRALTPPEILVVTFTDAATQELRERIRTRLSEAAACFLADPDSATVLPSPGEILLHELRAEYPPAHWPACARKLQLAAEWMDEAAVSTIHGWCNRMLREHAFDSDSLFTQTLETDQSELLAEVVRDYWRCFMSPLRSESAADVLAWWSGPNALQGDLRKLIDHADLLEARLEPSAALEGARENRQRRLAELKAPWANWTYELRSLLDAAVAGKCVNGKKLQSRYYLPWLEALRTWATDPQATSLELNTGWTRLTPDGLKEVWTQGEPPAHPALEAILMLKPALDELPDARVDLLRHAACWTAARFSAEQARHARMGFNDLLTRLDDALHGPNGQRLADIIRRQFPVALIDEFQDTDPVQYRIFDAVYRVADNKPGTALILIGDPKQAIYAFRGADIYTYLAARSASAGRLYTLKRNFRSTSAMVAATNHCFEAAESRITGAGAFLFRSERDNPVPFIAAEAQGRNEVLQVNDQLHPALTVWWLRPVEEGKPLSKEVCLEQMAAACASEMVRLLNLGQSGQAGLVARERLKGLRPADMAVLVNNGTESSAIRTALAARGIRSVYLSDKGSVFETAQAAEIQHWLAACAEPEDARLLRAALATATLCLSWSELDTLNHDELAWEDRVLQFRAYRDCWRRQGVLPMLRRLLNDFHVPARLLGGKEIPAENGERILTDILHLAELLQQASALFDGEHALIRYLAEQRQEAGRGAGGDARQLRLESDADLVQVVTVHKSKGLEYPLVFLPFASNFRATKAGDLPLKYHDAEGRLQLALTDTNLALEPADRERLGEDLRKLYVALTRARYATWVGIAPQSGLERSAFGYLLGGGKALNLDGLGISLNELRGACEHIAVAPAPTPTTERLKPRATATTSGTAREPQRVVRENWWIASYSALKAVDADERTVPDTPAEDVFHENRSAQNSTPVMEMPWANAAISARTATGTLHGLPRGADVGSFLHDLLEWAATQGFAEVASDPVLLGDSVARRCKVRGWAHWISPLTSWLQQFLLTPLQLPALNGKASSSFSLAGLESSIAEMEFWLAAHTVDITQIDQLIRTHTLDGEARPALQPGQLNGMLKGFIDLVFEHGGRYYVADYKSNWLGPDDAAYTPGALRSAILHSRYELQYVLYIFALHRLLKVRLPGYDYERHIGGAVYIFLRGLNAPGQGLHTECPPRALIESLDRLFAHTTSKEPA